MFTGLEKLRNAAVCLVVLTLTGISSSAMMQREPALDEAALLIYEYPDSAMAIVEKVEPRLAEDAAGNVLPGCLYASMASLFEYGFDYAKAVQYYEKGAKYFIRSKDYRNFTDMCIKAARCCYHMGEEDRAETFIDKVEPYKRYVEESNKVRYFRLILNMKHDIPIGDVMEAAAALGQQRGSSTEPGNLLAIADIYLKSGFPDSAMVYLERYRKADGGYGSNPIFYLRLSNVYDTLGRDREALDAYRKHVALKDSTYMDKISENVQLVAAMYDNYMQMSMYERVKRILWCSIVAVLLAAVAVVFYFRRKSWKQNRRAAYLEELYRNAAQ